MTRSELPETTARLAAIINRAWLAIDANPRAYDAAQWAAVRVLADAEIADGLAATRTLAAITDLHHRRRWQDSDVVVCDACQTAWPCPTAELLAGERVTA